ncbi:MAG: tRNA uridine(34) 5-carboxymethylaminomethyl modification radical SAM/GNAT enzyme Elp3, partial [bacterium]
MKKVFLTIMQKLIAAKPQSVDEFLRLKKDFAGEFHLSPPSTSTLHAAYHQLLKSGLKPVPEIEKMLRRKVVRTNSGISPITVLTKPYPCPGKCVYCPYEVTMPKSYLSNEPAAQRALLLRFDPYRQVSERIKSLLTIGHESTKIELIVKGGTWSSYPPKYQEWFLKRCFDAANHAGSKKIRSSNLAQSQTINERAKCRIIGLTLETRPDRITPKEVARLRMLGCTRIELGLQNTSDRILKLIERGHTTTDAKRALKLLRDAGFKTDLHMMPQLPGATPRSDLKMFEELFADPDYRPDMIKIYPCVVMRNSALYEWHQSGKFKPYSDKRLFETLIKIKTSVPYYCRVSRLVRDIPGSSIVSGNTITNLRLGLQQEMKARGLICKCLRCREIGHQESGRWSVVRGQSTTFFDEAYEASRGVEHFLSFEDPRRTVVFAF